MKRNARINSAQKWIHSVPENEKHVGKNTVRKYAKCYKVDLICAIKEVRLLGISVDVKYEALIRKDQENRIQRKKLKEAKRRKQEAITSGYGQLFGWDENFSFIAGFTSGGFPYGVSRDELNENKAFKENHQTNFFDLNENDIPEPDHLFNDAIGENYKNAHRLKDNCDDSSPIDDLPF